MRIIKVGSRSKRRLLERLSPSAHCSLQCFYHLLHIRLRRAEVLSAFLSRLRHVLAVVKGQIGRLDCE